MLTVDDSNTTDQSGATTDTRLVACAAGYNSSDGVTFNSTCSGTAPGVSAWSNVLTCDGQSADDMMSFFWACW